MVSKQWQKSQTWIQHSILILLSASFFYWLQQELLPWQKASLIGSSFLFVGITGWWFHKRFANKMVKVYRSEYQDVAWLIQRSLRSKMIPFVKNSEYEKIELKFYSKEVVLTAEPFPLNLMIDDHLTSLPATKITLSPIQQDSKFTQNLCILIDQAFLAKTSSSS